MLPYTGVVWPRIRVSYALAYDGRKFLSVSVDARSFMQASKVTVRFGAEGRRIFSKTSSAATCPISRRGCSTVVSCGFTMVDRIVPEKLAMPTSSGILTCRSLSSFMAPMASVSVKAKIASKDTSEARRRWAASFPFSIVTPVLMTSESS